MNSLYSTKRQEVRNSFQNLIPKTLTTHRKPDDVPVCQISIKKARTVPPHTIFFMLDSHAIMTAAIEERIRLLASYIYNPFNPCLGIVCQPRPLRQDSSRTLHYYSRQVLSRPFTRPPFGRMGFTAWHNQQLNCRSSLMNNVFIATYAFWSTCPRVIDLCADKILCSK